MNLGISFEPVLPLPADRGAPAAGGAAPGDFGEHLRTSTAPSRRADAGEPPNPSSDEALQSLESEIAPGANNETTPVATEEEPDEPEDTADEESAAATTTSETAPLVTASLGSDKSEEPALQPAVEDPEIPAAKVDGRPGPEKSAGSEISNPADAAAEPGVAAQPQVERSSKTSGRSAIAGEKALPKSGPGEPTGSNVTKNQLLPDIADSAQKRESRRSEKFELPSAPQKAELSEPAKETALLDSAPLAEIATGEKEGGDGEPHSSKLSARGDVSSSRLSSADRVRFVQRVARAVEAARPDGEIRLRLRPPELGSIHLRLKTEDGVLAARVETETRQAQTLLTEGLPELRERLAEMNIRMERFDVDYRGGEQERSPSFTKEGSQNNHEFGAPPRPPGRRETESTPKTSETTAVRRHRGDLDVVI